MQASSLIPNTETDFNFYKACQPVSSILIDVALNISSLTIPTKMWATTFEARLYNILSGFHGSVARH